jgi:hypothetical protein
MNVGEKDSGEARDPGALDSLLRCELSAVETYDQAIMQFEDAHVLADLQRIREDHARAVLSLRGKVAEFGGQPMESPGPWSTFTTITEMSRTLGLAALKQGEEHTINEYEESLRSENVNPECKELIRVDLLPCDKAHVEKLDRLMGGMT